MTKLKELRLVDTYGFQDVDDHQSRAVINEVVLNNAENLMSITQVLMLGSFQEHLLKNCLLKTIVGTGAPKEVLEKITIEEFELSFIEVSAVMYSIKR